jgi:hypothetical protein
VTSSASVVGARALRLGVRPATVPAGRRSCLRFRATGPGGGPVAGVKVRFGRARGRSGTGGALRLCERPLRRGMRKAVAAKAGYVPAAARVRVR